jgi:hypothetical protein
MRRIITELRVGRALVFDPMPVVREEPAFVRHLVERVLDDERHDVRQRVGRGDRSVISIGNFMMCQVKVRVYDEHHADEPPIR